MQTKMNYECELLPPNARKPSATQSAYCSMYACKMHLEIPTRSTHAKSSVQQKACGVCTCTNTRDAWKTITSLRIGSEQFLRGPQYSHWTCLCKSDMILQLHVNTPPTWSVWFCGGSMIIGLWFTLSVESIQKTKNVQFCFQIQIDLSFYFSPVTAFHCYRFILNNIGPTNIWIFE